MPWVSSLTPHRLGPIWAPEKCIPRARLQDTLSMSSRQTD